MGKSQSDAIDELRDLYSKTSKDLERTQEDVSELRGLKTIVDKYSNLLILGFAILLVMVVSILMITFQSFMETYRYKEAKYNEYVKAVESLDSKIEALQTEK